MTLRELAQPRWLLSTLLIAGAALFAIGVATERNTADTHTEANTDGADRGDHHRTSRPHSRSRAASRRRTELRRAGTVAKSGACKSLCLRNRSHHDDRMLTGGSAQLDLRCTALTKFDKEQERAHPAALAHLPKSTNIVVARLSLARSEGNLQSVLTSAVEQTLGNNGGRSTGRNLPRNWIEILEKTIVPLGLQPASNTRLTESP